jgi:hypothetical protein
MRVYPWRAHQMAMLISNIFNNDDRNQSISGAFHEFPIFFQKTIWLGSKISKFPPRNSQRWCQNGQPLARTTCRTPPHWAPAPGPQTGAQGSREEDSRMLQTKNNYVYQRVYNYVYIYTLVVRCKA